MVAEREVFIKEHGGIKNDFYERNLDTTPGKLKNLKVPRDREGKFRTKLIEPYKRREISLEDLILGMFVPGMSGRTVIQALASVFELKYSPSTISKISQVTLEEINKWKQKKLKRRYSVIMLGSQERTSGNVRLQGKVSPLCCRTADRRLRTNL